MLRRGRVVRPYFDTTKAPCKDYSYSSPLNFQQSHSVDLQAMSDPGPSAKPVFWHVPLSPPITMIPSIALPGQAHAARGRFDKVHESDLHK